MKIVVAGSHGTGKTSFGEGLAKRLNCNFIHDIVRFEVAPAGFDINESTSPEMQLWLTMRQWWLEKTTPESWVADKCLFDYLVYGDIILQDKDIKKIIRRIVKDNAHYDFVFYLPIEFPMEEDGMRSKKLQEKANRQYKKLLDGWGIKYIILPSYCKESVSPEEAIEKRINQALEHLK